MLSVIIKSIDHLEKLGYQKFHIQNEDDYMYRPSNFEFNKEELLMNILTKTPKVDWGMIWCTI